MIKREDLQEAIAECQGQRNPNANTCIKLAAFYTILDRMEEANTGYSYAPAIINAEKINYYSDSDFSHVIYGRDPEAVWAVMDELMDTLKVMYPKLYDSVMRRVAD